jgi:hypothetical protein
MSLRKSPQLMPELLAACYLPSGPFESSRSWQDSLPRRPQWTTCRPRQRKGRLL